jgi:MtrB/PioB family decaheme-associated outer membrane protein
LNWTGDKAHLTGGYFGSLFHDSYNSLNWQSSSNPDGGVGASNNTMSTAPSNSLHQANLSGGYDFSSSTKLAGGFSYGYNTQNQNYAPTSILQPGGGTGFMMQNNGLGLPASSLNGQVQTTHGDLKLTNQSIKDLTLTAGFKFNQRDNQTNSNAYSYRTIDGRNYLGVNTPYSNRKIQYEAAAAYQLTKAQNLRLAYEREDIKRWCNDVANGGAQCISSPSSEEDKASLTYRLKALENVNFNAGYSFAKRNAHFDHNFLANAGNYSVTTAGTAHTVLNAGDRLGFVAYPYANRAQNMMKTGVTWQATEKLDFGVNGRYTYDDYNATLGVQNGRSAAVNLDANYNYADNSSISAYWSWQNGYRMMRNGNNGGTVIAPTNIWTNKLEDNGHSFGILTKNGGLLNNKLEILGDFSYSIDKSIYATQVPYPPSCSASSRLTCGDLSPIQNGLLSLKLTGNYQVHKNGKIALAYVYQKLNSNDYFYNGQQFGTTPDNVVPTGLQMQSYAVNVVALSYNYNF